MNTKEELQHWEMLKKTISSHKDIDLSLLGDNFTVIDSSMGCVLAKFRSLEEIKSFIQSHKSSMLHINQAYEIQYHDINIKPSLKSYFLMYCIRDKDEV